MGQMSPASNWVGLQVRAPDAVMIVPTGLVRGVHEITLFVSHICAELAKRGPTSTCGGRGSRKMLATSDGSPRRPITYPSSEPTRSRVRHNKIAVQIAFKTTLRA